MNQNVIPHFLAHTLSNEGLGLAVTLARIFRMSESVSPVVARIVSTGKLKKATAAVWVPGSRWGKLAMNCASLQPKFWAKCIKPAHQHTNGKVNVTTILEVRRRHQWGLTLKNFTSEIPTPCSNNIVREGGKGATYCFNLIQLLVCSPMSF